MKTTKNAFIKRLLGVLMFSFIMGCFVKTVESHKEVILKDFIEMASGIVSDIAPKTINSKVAFIERIPTYTVKPHIGLQMNMSNNVIYGCDVPAYNSVPVFNTLDGRTEDPPSIDPESG